MKQLIHKIGQLVKVDFEALDVFIPENEEQRRINLTSVISLITIFNMLVYAIIYSFIDIVRFSPAIVFLSLAAMVNLGLIVINKRGNFQLAKILLSVFTPLYMLFIVLIVFGKAPGFQVYLFVAAIIPLFLWDLRRNWKPIVLIVFILLSYLLVEMDVFRFYAKIQLTPHETKTFLQTNIFACFIASGIAIGLYQKLQSKTETQLISQTQKLQITQKQKDKIYSIIGHDLRGPIATFMGLSELYVKNFETSSENDKLELMRAVHKKSVSIMNLLENLLDWSRIQTGDKKITFSEIILAEIANETIHLYEDWISEKEIDFVSGIDARLKLHANRHMVFTVFRNIISNAIKFTPAKGTIEISAKTKEKWIEICIRDSGVGLNKNDLDLLFDSEKAYRIAPQSSEKGSGLGLILCKDFIEKHKGKIYVESKPGVGTAMYFTLPAFTD